MIFVNCQTCGVEIEAQRTTRKFCKTCMAKRNSAIPRNKEKQRIVEQRWRENNPEKHREKSRRWYRNNPEAGKAAPRKWNAKHPEKLKEYRARTYQNHKESRDARARLWVETHPEETKASRIQRNHRRRAKVAQAEGEWNFSEFQSLCEASDNRCYYCHKQVDKLTADHMTPITRGGSNWIENIIPACRSCNSSKGTKTLMEYCFPLWRA